MLDGCMEQKLTAEERAFVAGLVTGETRAEAYRKAFSRKEMTDAAARKAAQRLSQKDYIVDAVEVAKREAGQVKLVADVPAVLGRQEFLAQVLEEARAATRPSDRLRALEIYGKFAYGNEPMVQVNTAVQVGVSAASVLDAIEPPELG